MSIHRKNIMLGTAGHVDHGKTALVRTLTGCNTDTLAEEQRRGLTIDLGFAPCRMADERIVGIVDVPGHVDFIRNMVAGAHGIDVVIFVVAADDGIMPQTREHLDILTLMGVRGGIVALTKIDLVPPDIRQIVVDDLRELVKDTFLADAAICGVSNITGEGYGEFFDSLNAAVVACPERNTTGLFRAWVEDVHAIRGFGTVATGIPVSGAVRVGDRLRVLPAGRGARVRKLEVYGQDAPEGRAGECVAVNLSDVQAAELSRGMLLCEGDSFSPVTMAEAQLRLLGHVSRPLKDYAEVHLHVGTAEAAARIAMLEAKDLAPGRSQMVQLRLDRPLPLAAGDRFVIRADLGGPTAGRLTTIGGGRLASASNIRLRRNRPWTIAALADRLAAIDSPSAWLGVVLQQAQGCLSAAELAAAAQMKAAQVDAALGELVRAGAAVAVAGGTYAHPDTIAHLSRRIMEAVEKFHADNPHRIGIDEGELAKALDAPKPLMDLAAVALVTEKKLCRQGTLLMQAGRRAQVSRQDQDQCDKIERTLKSAHLSPPLAGEIAAAAGLDAAGAARLGKLLALLADRGAAVKLDDKLWMHADAVAAARDVALELFRAKGNFETVEFRDALGVSRKFAVPLLDYFDGVRLTARSGSRRSPGAAAKALLDKKS